jgi:thymidine phosphorylase
MLLGAGRERVTDRIDLGAGIVIRKKPGDPVAAGETLLDLHYNDDSRLDAAVELATTAIAIDDAAPAARPLVLDHVT